MNVQPASLSRMMQLLKEQKAGVEQLDMEIVPGKLYREKETGKY